MATMGYLIGWYDKSISDQVTMLRKAGRAAMIALQQCGVAGGDVRSESVALTPDTVREIVKEELSGAVQDLDSKLNHSKELTEKKWSDLFKSNKDDLKNQKKQATKQRLELEKTMADNKRQTVVDNLERQKRASNICVSNVAESKKTDKKEKYEEECDTVVNILQLNADAMMSNMYLEQGPSVTSLVLLYVCYHPLNWAIRNTAMAKDGPYVTTKGRIYSIG